MKKNSRDVLTYLYKHKIENGIESISSLIQLPNVDGIQDLYHGGYVDITRGNNQSIKTIFITGKGIDWIKENLGDRAKLAEIQVSSEVSINSDVISIKIRDEIYGHIKSFLDSGHYFTAVEEAYKVVREKLKEITGEEVAASVFGENALNNKHWEKIFGSVPGIGTPESDFMRGAGYIHLGVQYLRNEKTHTTATSLDKNLALHYISLASLAYDLVTRN